MTDQKNTNYRQAFHKKTFTGINADNNLISFISNNSITTYLIHYYQGKTGTQSRKLQIYYY